MLVQIILSSSNLTLARVQAFGSVISQTESHVLTTAVVSKWAFLLTNVSAAVVRQSSQLYVRQRALFV